MECLEPPATCPRNKPYIQENVCVRECGNAFYYDFAENGTNFKCVSVCPAARRFVDNRKCTSGCESAIYEVSGAALRCASKCQQYLGIDTELEIYDQFRCAASCLEIVAAPFTESRPRAVTSPSAEDVSCRDGCWLTNSTYWAETRVCVDIAECPAYIVEDNDNVCVQECPRVQLRSRQCLDRCPGGQYTDTNKICTTICSTNAY